MCTQVRLVFSDDTDLPDSFPCESFWAMWNGVPSAQAPVFKNWTDAEKRKKIRSDQAAAKKAREADKLLDNFMVVAAIKLHLDWLPPGQWMDSEPILRECRTLPARWKPYLYAARRILGVKWRPGNGTVRRLLKTAHRVRLIGIFPRELTELAELPFGFNSTVLREFSERLQVLDLTKRYLKSHAQRLQDTIDAIDDGAPPPPELWLQYTPAPPTIKAGVANLKRSIYGNIP